MANAIPPLPPAPPQQQDVTLVQVRSDLLRQVMFHLAQPRINAYVRAALRELISTVLTPKFDFEVKPTLTKGDATQWSVYRRPRAGAQRLAEWVADCRSKDVAMSLAATLRQQQDEVRENSHG